MRFQVPQFIEIEDKIVGPLTIKQFLYIAGGAGMSILALRLLPMLLAVMAIAFIIALSGALAFFNYNGKPFVDLLEAGIKFYLGEKLYIWKKRERVVEAKKESVVLPPQVSVPRLSDSKLKELSWSLDIKENQNPVTPNSTENIVQ